MYIWGPAVFRLGLVYNPTCDICKQTFETTSHVPCDCEAFTAFRSRHLGQHFLKQSDFDNISVSRVFVLCSHCGAAECVSHSAAHSFDHSPSARVTLLPTLMYSVLGVSLTHGALMLQGVRVLTYATVHASVTYLRETGGIH
jgi:hypothetical protein